MLGLELKIGSNIVGAKLGNRCITITIDKIGNDFFLKFSGSDFDENQSFTWHESLISDEKIKITVKQINHESTEIRLLSIMEDSLLTEEEQNRQDKKNLLRYNYLKKIIKERQLL